MLIGFDRAGPGRWARLCALAAGLVGCAAQAPRTDPAQAVLCEAAQRVGSLAALARAEADARAVEARGRADGAAGPEDEAANDELADATTAWRDAYRACAQAKVRVRERAQAAAGAQRVRARRDAVRARQRAFRDLMDEPETID